MILNIKDMDNIKYLNIIKAQFFESTLKSGLHLYMWVIAPYCEC